MGLYRYNRFKPISAKPYWILSNGGLYVFQIWVVWFCLPETQTTNQVALQFWFIYNKSQDICHKHTVDVVFPIYSYFKQVGDVFACIPDVLYIQYASADMCNHCFIDEITTKWCLMSFMIFMVGLKYLEKWMCRPILPSIYIYTSKVVDLLGSITSFVVACVHKLAQVHASCWILSTGGTSQRES